MPRFAQSEWEPSNARALWDENAVAAIETGFPALGKPINEYLRLRFHIKFYPAQKGITRPSILVYNPAKDFALFNVTIDDVGAAKDRLEDNLLELGPDSRQGRTAAVIPADGFADGGAAYTDEEMDLMEGKPDPNAAQRADDNASRRRFVQVTFEDGEVIRTSINGTKSEIETYYLSQEFTRDDETTRKAVEVEFIS
jgi:hypothetical protein